MIAQPLPLEIMHFIIEILALLFQYETVGKPEELLVGEVGDILGMDLPEGSLYGGPGILKIDLIAVEAL